MKSTTVVLFAALALGSASAQGTDTIAAIVTKDPQFSTLLAALKAAGLDKTLAGKGPFTVFAPTNAAFSMLPAGTVDNLLKPENKSTLVKVLTYHVVPGRLMAEDLMELIKKGGGRAMLTTADGEKLTVKMNGPRNIVVVDSKGNVANISTYDVVQSNGVIHVIDHVLMP